MSQESVVLTFESPEALGHRLALHIVEQIAVARAEGRRFVWGCPGGRTGRPTYDAVARAVATLRLPMDHVVIAMMDEYVVPAPAGSFTPVPSDVHHSCRGFAEREIVAPINAATPLSIPPEQVWVPDPARPDAYEELLGETGVDLFLLASGAGDGHVAFNAPGTERATRTRVVALPESTRRDNLVTFPQFGGLADVPSHGVTVGIATILEVSRELVMVLTGADKRAAFERITGAADYDPAWPATVVRAATTSGLIMADDSAAGGLEAAEPG